jgi:energy-coupling factor transporter ATP-binding protein EcfA2
MADHRRKIMTRHLNYNPGRDSVAYLEAINYGDNRLHILDQLLISLRAEIGRPNHQHHLLIGPRGSGKTHLLRILTAGRIPADPTLAAAYLPVVMPEETPLRTPGDLLLKFVERLAGYLKKTPPGIDADKTRSACTQCLTALTIARGMKDPLERLPLMAETLEAIGKTLDRILLPIAENMDQTFYLGAKGSRKNPMDEQWALRRIFQDSAHLLLIGAAPVLFGAVEDPSKAFFDFFRTHHLNELSPDEVLEIIRRRLEYEKANPCDDVLRRERISSLIDHFTENSPKLRGLIVITGGLPRFIHLIYEVIVDTDVNRILDTLNGFLDDLTPYFQTRLDPRLIPQAEIDLLHTLASARGPLQPLEMAEELYGVPTNEVSELLNRLHERGLVKRAGRPGGQAVTWDLTEPLYRVWTRFRNNPDAQDLYQMLAKFVALLFSMPEIEKERKNLSEKIASLPDGHIEKIKFSSRYRLIENAFNELVNSKIDVTTETVEKTNMVDNGSSINKTKSIELFESLNEALENGNMDHALSLLEELRHLNATYPEDDKVRVALAGGLAITIVNAGNEGYVDPKTSLLQDLRNLSNAFPKDDWIDKALIMEIFSTYCDASSKGDKKQSRSLLSELLELSAFKTDEMINEAVNRAIMIYIMGILVLIKNGESEPARKGMKWLEALVPTHLSDFMRPMTLAMDVLEKGEEKALARESEEVKRVVRLVIKLAEERAIPK